MPKKPVHVFLIVVVGALIIIALGSLSQKNELEQNTFLKIGGEIVSGWLELMEDNEGETEAEIVIELDGSFRGHAYRNNPQSQPLFPPTPTPVN